MRRHYSRRSELQCWKAIDLKTSTRLVLAKPRKQKVSRR